MSGRAYAGIGSRETPANVLEVMRQLAQRLALNGWVLRSGHAPGADQAFEAGAGPQAEVYLPWASFEQQVKPVARFVMNGPIPTAYEIASRFHPGWMHLTDGARSLHARNAHQVLGANLDPERRVSMVACWTKDGSIDGGSRASGGTGQALRIATAYGVEVFNLARRDHFERIAGYIS